MGGEYFITLVHLYVIKLYHIPLTKILLIRVIIGCSNYKRRIDFILICHRVLHVSPERIIIRHYNFFCTVMPDSGSLRRNKNLYCDVG